MRNTNQKLQLGPKAMIPYRWSLYTQCPKRAVNEVGCVEQGGTNGLENGELTKD